jgi:hypothetical protein
LKPVMESINSLFTSERECSYLGHCHRKLY